jgi:hypothetical protein
MGDWASLVNHLNAAVLGAFGREVTYVPQAGASVTVRAVFESTRESQENSPGVFAVLFLRLADLARPPERGDTVRIGGVPYKVFEIEGDGQGGVRLGLHQA